MRIFSRIIFILFTALIAARHGVAQVSLFVSPAGSATAKGTIEAPFNSLQKALAYAGQQGGQQVTIYLREGTYYLNTTIVLNRPDFSPASLVIQPYRQEHITLSARRRLSLKWEAYPEGIYMGKIPAGISF